MHHLLEHINQDTDKKEIRASQNFEATFKEYNRVIYTNHTILRIFFFLSAPNSKIEISKFRDVLFYTSFLLHHYY